MFGLLAKLMKRAGDPRKALNESDPKLPYARGQKKFSEFCGHSREVTTRSPPEDPRLFDRPPAACVENKCSTGRL
jgi:hypothetical protein